MAKAFFQLTRIEEKVVTYYLFHYRLLSLINEGVHQVASFYHVYHALF